MQFVFAEIVCQLPVEAKENEKLYATHELVKLDCMRTESASVTQEEYMLPNMNRKKKYMLSNMLVRASATDASSLFLEDMTEN
jgi:hypothetical protein